MTSSHQTEAPTRPTSRLLPLIWLCRLIAVAAAIAIGAALIWIPDAVATPMIMAGLLTFLMGITIALAHSLAKLAS